MQDRASVEVEVLLKVVLAVMPVLVSGAILVFGRKYIGDELDRKLASFKIKLSHLHEKTGETLAGLYALVVTTERALAVAVDDPRVWTSDPPFQLDSEQMAAPDKALGAAYHQLDEFFRSHEVYLTDDTARRIREYLGLVRESGRAWFEGLGGDVSLLTRSSQRLKEEAARTRAGILKDFRRVLGGEEA